MNDTPNIRSTVERYFAAMQRGAEAEDEMMALFSDNATYTEPFGGQMRTSVGRDAAVRLDTNSLKMEKSAWRHRCELRRTLRASG